MYNETIENILLIIENNQNNLRLNKATSLKNSCSFKYEDSNISLIATTNKDLNYLKFSVYVNENNNFNTYANFNFRKDNTIDEYYYTNYNKWWDEEPDEVDRFLKGLAEKVKNGSYNPNEVMQV